MKNVLAIIAGFIVGSIVNMGLIVIGGQVVPPPDGVNVMDHESIAASMHLFEARHFIFPFLAHALGALTGALTISLVATSHRLTFSLAIGAFFMLGGIANAFMLPAPAWFIALDLVCAYIPMAWLGFKLSKKPS